jgi:hypothetical protein
MQQRQDALGMPDILGNGAGTHSKYVLFFAP